MEPGRRRYDSPLRRRQAAETRERIVDAGAELIHGFPIWNWGALTVRAVARGAGVNERTVYRHFSTERGLRDAVLEKLKDEAGVEIQGLTLDGLKDVGAKTFRYVARFPLEPRLAADPTVAAENERQRQALLSALAPHTPHWSDDERRIAAGILDVLWSVVSYERLVSGWGLDPEGATRAVMWAMGLIEAAVAGDQRPTRS